MESLCSPTRFLFFFLLCIIFPSIEGATPLFYSAWSRCPQSCDISGPNPSNWTYYHDDHALDNCNETTLFQMNIYNSISDPKTHVTFQACKTSGTPFGASSETTAISKRQVFSFNSTTGYNSNASNATLPSQSGNACADESQAIQTAADVHLLSWGTASGASNTTQLVSVIQQLSNYLQDDATCGRTNMFARSGNVVAGVYVGSQIQKRSAASIIQKLVDTITAGSPKQSLALQLCESEAINTQVFGLFIGTAGNVSTVQEGLKNWNNAECVVGSDHDTIWQNTPILMIPGTEISVQPVTGVDDTTDAGHASSLVRRNTCSYTQAVSGDGCFTIAQRCGITQDQLSQYNGGGNFCGTIQVGQYVCCSAGTLPDFTPQPQPDGSCTTYIIQTGDLCSAIANAHTMTPAQIESRNNNTWGWMGCSDLQIGQIICLSTGTPPMPVNNPNAVCGPQVNGTAKPADLSKLASLNPCPLNAW
jgi:chitinase